MFDFAAKFERALSYEKFLAAHGSDEHCRRWATMHASIQLSEPQLAALKDFRREMKVLCVAGTWCGDCVNQCPIFDHFAHAAPAIQLRFMDRDADPDLAGELKICGGGRVPVVVFLSEDGQLVGWYGDRTISKYRQMAVDQLGSSCPTGIVPPGAALTAAVVQDWLDEFERVQLLLRISPRLRQLHGD
ncbi:MAG TPA: thioredoxin family protein [Pirellulales bacterium]|jgi:thiol-disulfide isomerase/thioredoxin|nr:thioredoxin family protein [Pirellulales bacterium]